MLQIKKSIFGFLSFLAVLVLSFSAQAEEKENINKVNFEKYRIEQILPAFNKSKSPVKGCAKPNFKMKSSGYDIIKPIVFPSNMKNPKEGVWYELIESRTCGDIIKSKVLLKANNGKVPQAFPFLPGNSHASPVLQKDASTSAFIMVMQNSKCTYSPYMTDSALVKKQKNGVWQERWTFKSCGATKNVLMTFTPDTFGSGTSFQTSLE